MAMDQTGGMGGMGGGEMAAPGEATGEAEQAEPKHIYEVVDNGDGR